MVPEGSAKVLAHAAPWAGQGSGQSCKPAVQALHSREAGKDKTEKRTRCLNM